MNTTLWEPIYRPLESSFLCGGDDRVTVLCIGDKALAIGTLLAIRTRPLCSKVSIKKQLCLVLIKVKEMTKLSHGFYFIPGIPH